MPTATGGLVFHTSARASPTLGYCRRSALEMRPEPSGLDARLEAPATANTGELKCAFRRDSVESRQCSAFNLKPTDLTETMTRRSPPVGSSLRRRLPTCTS